MKNRIIYVFILFFLIMKICNPLVQANMDLVDNEAREGAIQIIPIEGVIDPGVAKFVERGIKEAQENNAEMIIFEINTPGGRIDAAKNISDLIFSTNIETTAFVKGEATSAGVLITISCENVFMKSNSTIGAAEPRPADEKTISYWTSALEGAAERTGRNPKIIGAMSDKEIEIEDVVKKGEILSLTAKRAFDLGIADEVLDSRIKVIEYLDFKSYDTFETNPTFAERLASVVTSPYISPMLLTIGFVGLISEISSAGFGVGGFIGLSSFALFFGGHLIADFAGVESIIIFILGIGFLIVEILAPGFGVFGILGIVGIIVGILIASVSIEQGLLSIIISIGASVIILSFLFKYLAKSPFFSNLILTITEDKNSGYIAPVNKEKLIGKTGTTITPLRPSGSVDFGDDRIDVVSEGGYIEANLTVKVVKVEGTRVIVRKI